jgi:hypothetical protein
MKKYCFDTSGLSNPLENMPSDIHDSLWVQVLEFFEAGNVAITTEIYEEMILLPDGIGDQIKAAKESLILEVGESTWNWQDYINNSNRMQDDYHDYISEFTGGSSKTICLNDLSIVALARTLNLPLVNMESFVSVQSPNKRRIPNICSYEEVTSLNFNEFLRNEGFKF